MRTGIDDIIEIGGMDMVKKIRIILLGLIILLACPSMAPGQAVFLARKALGLVSRIADQFHGHETASVLLEADANKVFTAAERIIRENPANAIISTEKTFRTISFKHNGFDITLKVARLQEDLAQILVVSSGNNTTQDTDYAVKGILRVCREVRASCRLSNE